MWKDFLWKGQGFWLNIHILIKNSFSENSFFENLLITDLLIRNTWNCMIITLEIWVDEVILCYIHRINIEGVSSSKETYKLYPPPKKKIPWPLTKRNFAWFVGEFSHTAPFMFFLLKDALYTLTLWLHYILSNLLSCKYCSVV